jgi:hypothetical protein
MIKSRCTECGATSLEGILQHTETCTATLMKPSMGQELRPSATVLIFGSPEEQKKFMDNLRVLKEYELR